MQVFFCEYCENTYFEEHVWTAASECINKKDSRRLRWLRSAILLTLNIFNQAFSLLN